MDIYPYSQTHIDLNKYEKGTLIRKNTSGSVYLVQEKESGDTYFAKTIDCNNNEDQCTKIVDFESSIFLRVSHPNIIKFIGISIKDFQGENNATLIIEYLQNGSLADVLKKIQIGSCPNNYNNTIKQNILIGVARGMKYLHDRNIAHGNLKSTNILLDNEFHPKISDFNINHSKSELPTIDTLKYMSPETLKSSVYDKKSDVYSFAILIYEILTDSLLFSKIETNFDYVHKIVNENYRPKFEVSVKNSLRTLVEECWSSDPQKRPSFNEIFEKLSKPKFFISDDVNQSDVELYIQSINKCDDCFEELVQQNEKLACENSNLTILNNEYTKVNEQLTIKYGEVKGELDKFVKTEPIVTVFYKNNYFVDYINSQNIEPVSEIDEKTKNEIQNLSAQHPTVLGFNDRKRDSQIIIQNYGMIISYYKIKGTMNQQDFSILNDKSKFFIILTIALEMQHLHSRNIQHCNLKPETILINDENLPIICDFGLTKYTNDNFFNCSNPIFIPPEFFEENGNENSLKSDVYSFGMIVYSLFAHQKPKIDCPPYMLVPNIVKGKRPDLKFIENRKIKKLIQMCWSKNSKNRPSFNEIIGLLLDNPFYTDLNINNNEIVKFMRIFPIEQRNLPCVKNILMNFKIVCLGNPMTGKTCLINTYHEKKKTDGLFQTMGIEFITSTIQTNHGGAKLIIWDTCGQRSYLVIIKESLFKNTDAFILFTDIHQPQEYNDLQHYLDAISEFLVDNEIKLYLVATKADLPWNNTKEELHDFAQKHKMKLFITSLNDLNSINSVFTTIATDLSKL